eukprot:Opistho-2@365
MRPLVPTLYTARPVVSLLSPQRAMSSSTSSAVAPSPASVSPLNPQGFTKWTGGALTSAGRGGRSSVSGVLATVFGASGFLGRYVVNRLGRNGSQVIVPYRGEEYDVGHLKPMGDLGQITFREYHLKDDASLAKMVQYSNVVINLIGSDYETRHFTLNQVHVDGARAIARACRNAGVERLIHISALGASIASPSRFLRTKALGEEAVREEFPAATILRPGTLTGKEDRFLNRYAQYATLPFGVPLGNAEAKRSPVYVVDAAQAVINAFKEPATLGRTYELAGPKSYTMNEVVHLVSAFTRRHPVAYSIPKPFYVFGGRLLGMNPVFRPLLTEDQAIRDTLDEVTTADAPGLEDLGVLPTPIEKIALGILRRYRTALHFQESVDEVKL